MEDGINEVHKASVPITPDITFLLAMAFVRRMTYHKS